MLIDNILTGLVLIVAFYVLFFISKVVSDLLHREYKLNHELVENDNPALALAMVGYYGGLVVALGGTLVGPSAGLVNDLIDLGLYGILAIVLLNVSWYLCDWLILPKFKISDELIRDRNQGTGAVSGGVSLASGFIIYGAVQGEGGGVLTALVYWAVGQFILILGGLLYDKITPYSVHDEIEKDNVAAGISFGGALASLGVIIGLSATGDFESWSESLTEFIGYSVIGLVLLAVIRFLTDKILLPGAKLSDEIAGQETPNQGAAYIEAMSYVTAAFIIHWCV